MFTSRLPISTSARRPTNPADNRPSNIPVTVRKANLFTPQTKRPYSIGTSTAGKSFTSGSATERKFQRSLKPAPDRDAQQRMFDNLVEFLRTYAPGFPCPEAKKFFSSVSTTESSRIFELLISRLIPDFKIKRLEVDVPEALALLDYPFIRSVTKSSLVSVTTRQAAAGLLHIFDWLANNIPIVDEHENEDDDDEPMSEREVVFNSAFLLADNAVVVEENMNVLTKMISLDDDGRLEYDQKVVGEELERLQLQMEGTSDLQQDMYNLEEDIRKIRDYHAQMRVYLQTKIAESNEVDQKYLDSKKQREEDLCELERLKHAINGHKLDIDQVNREQSNQARLERTLQTFRDQRIQAESESRQVESRCQDLIEVSNEWASKQTNEMEKIARLKLEVANRNYAEVISNKESRLSDLERQNHQREQESIRSIKILQEARDLENQNFENCKRNITHLTESSKVHLQTSLESQKQRILSLTNDVKKRAEDLKKAELAWESHKMAVKKIYNSLKGPLNLP